MERVKIAVEAREAEGTPAARALRRAGKVPGILYGNGREPSAIAIEAAALREALSGEAGRHAIFEVDAPGSRSPVPAILKDFQLHPVRDTLLHIDLLEIRMDQPIASSTSVVLVGEPQGVKMDGGVLDQPVHELAIEALPGDLVDHVDVDVSALGVGDSVRVADLTPPPGVTITADSELVIASVTVPTQVEAPEAEEAEEGAEGAEAAAAEEAGEEAEEA